MSLWRSMSLWGLFLAFTFLPADLSAQEPEALHFRFREPHPRTYVIDSPPAGAARRAAGEEWLTAHREGQTNIVQFGRRITIQVAPEVEITGLIEGRPLEVVRLVAPQVYILQAPDALTAAGQARSLSGVEGVILCQPVMRRSASADAAYARRPNDPYIAFQWYLEYRGVNGSSLGADINVRSAWPVTRGEGVVVAVADKGVELSHNDLKPRAHHALHHDFVNGGTNAVPGGTEGTWAHGTAVAGLVAAQANNAVGMSGVAPAASLASWRIFAGPELLVDDATLMEMYQHISNSVPVQNHSWGIAGFQQDGPTLLEQIGISNALAYGRDGKGVIMVRAAGNDPNNRFNNANANDNAYASDPRVIAVGAVREDGRVTTFSQPGACVLVAAPTETLNGSGVFTTDLTGTVGVNQVFFGNDLADYMFNDLGFNGTSAAAPQVSGIAALLLSVNPALHYRDVQQILLLASRHYHLADPDLSTNAAGLRVSHNIGFGVPDSGWAVAMAAGWPNRPALTTVSLVNATPIAIPDAGLRLLITGDAVPSGLQSIIAAPGNGLHPDSPTGALRLVDVGTASAPIVGDLTGAAALIQRSASTSFATQAVHAANAGAKFAVIYNTATGNPPGDALTPMGGMFFVPIPAVFIGQTAGEALAGLFDTDPTALGQLQQSGADITFNVTDTLSLEHVSVKVTTDHTYRGDLRITLTSPGGTRSVLQNFGKDSTAGPNGWVYHSVHHFYEASAGAWTVTVADAFEGGAGSVQEVALTLTGVAITDTDSDGLDDAWEQTRFGSLAHDAKADPDGDGYANAREQVLGTDPTAADVPFKMDLSPWNSSLARISWPGVTNQTYDVFAGVDPGQPLTLLTNVPGRFPEASFYFERTSVPHRFFRVQTSVAP